MTAGQAAVAEARCWLGTPYVHQASRNGAGTDCLGLIRGVWRALYGAEPEVVPAYTPDWSEPTHTETLLQAGHRHFVAKPREVENVGDVIVFRMRASGVAKHLGIQSCTGAEARFIHAYSGHSVMESALTDPWRRRIAARFAFPDGAF